MFRNDFVEASNSSGNMAESLSDIAKSIMDTTTHLGDPREIEP